MDETKEIIRKKHHRHRSVNTRNLLVAGLLNLVITVVEIAGGILSNSLALLADASHHLSNTFATFIAYFASRIGKGKDKNLQRYGFKRTEILAAMLNTVILIIVCIFLFKEAWLRLQNPYPVNSLIVIIVAMIGLGGNILSISLLHKDFRISVVVRKTYHHLIGDGLSSVIVILTAAAIQLFGISWLDPLVTFLIGLYLIREAYIIMKEALNILMQSAPEHIDLKKIRFKVESLPEIHSIHHLHVWNISENETHLDAHIEIHEDLRISEIQVIREQLEKMLMKKFRIRQVTLQFEIHSARGKRENKNVKA